MESSSPSAAPLEAHRSTYPLVDRPEMVVTIATIEAMFEGASRETHDLYFQIIDSLVAQYTKDGRMPSSRQFPFYGNMDAASVIETWMAKMNDNAEMMSLDRFRSKRPELPIIVPDLFAAPSQGTIRSPAAEASSEEMTQDESIPASFTTSTSQAFDSSDDQLAWPPEFEELPTLAAVQPYRTGRYHAFIRNTDHFYSVKLEYQGSNNKVGKANVPDAAAESMETILGRIEQMFYAIKNTDQILETKRVVCKRKADGEQADRNSAEPVEVADSFAVKRTKQASDIEVELACWEIYEAMADAQSGNVWLSTWANNNSFVYVPYPSMEARFQQVLMALTYSKSVFNAVMVNDFTLRFVAAPENEYNKKDANKILNNKRNYQNKAGIQALAQNIFQVDANDNVITPTGQLVAAAAPTVAVANPTGAPPRPTRTTKRRKTGANASNSTETENSQ